MEVSWDLNSLAVLLRHQHRLTEAERILRRSLAIADRYLAPGDPHRGTGLGNLGLLIAHAGRLEEGETLLQRALSFARKGGRPNIEIAVGFNNLAEVLALKGEFEEAQTRYGDGLGALAQLARRVVGRE